MESPAASGVIQVKKYPNRRFYDTTRSRHVTLKDLHELVRSGGEIRVADSRSGDDITNVVLLQILLDKDPPKLGVLPPAVLHLLLRTRPAVLKDAVERIGAPFLNFLSASEEQAEAFWRRAINGELGSVRDWADGLAHWMSPAARGGRGARTPAESQPDAQTLEGLHERVADLSRRIEQMQGSDSASDPSRPHGDGGRLGP